MKFLPSSFKNKTSIKKPVVIPSGKHTFERKFIEKGVIDILNRLKKNGYEAYLVGGCIRDILLGMKPKDFDIVTGAHPRQIKRLFSRCFLIGKRFRLAHVYISHDRFVEVATFRAASSEIKLPDGRVIQNNNIYGTIEEDVLRRDFTANSLYYNLSDSSIIDYTGGFKDIKKRVLRTIGDPSVRFEEDPVRIIRAARFCARFNFKISGSDYRAAKDKAHLIVQSNANRLLDELFKILKCGASTRSFEYLDEFGVLSHWIPEILPLNKKSMLLQRLTQLDTARLDDVDFSNALLLTILFYDVFDNGISRDIKNPHDVFLAARDIFAPIATRMRIPKKDCDRICNILSRRIYFLDNLNKKYTPSFERRFTANEHFAEALKFYSLLAKVDANFSQGAFYWQKAKDSHDSKISYPSTRGKRTVNKKKKTKGKLTSPKTGDVQ
ncbi:MAG TPA: polynucleotide adenylyltransferase PcnB [Spirochaetota bacterium]|jgi:poly(A) polymerase|nr:polynucleotide adenylyltransferase PcnB [Spirochaetota bacterium]HOK91894.1 polynucleotide adenylyltransferase PcnB [Spirochaetota bacterium]HPP95399.1 polynucleotide adenylyltransferase PcnB [Spirochaetota bacterium]HRU65745.1 polynucleotide adenylyltransferase PcnB [Spirochaetota bacterium]